MHKKKRKKNPLKAKTVELLKKDGVLLKKDFYDIGKVAGATFQNIVITDIRLVPKTGALRIETSILFFYRNRHIYRNVRL